MIESHNTFGSPASRDVSSGSCLFLSHRLADSAVTCQIARYMDFIGQRYYFDEDDEFLSELLSCGHSNDRALVEAIDCGLKHSTHLLAILSARTMGSWWVPYEIGAARARGYPIAHLLLPSIKPEMLPEYLRLYPQLWTPEELFAWIKELASWPSGPLLRSHRDFLSDGLFSELGPDEEEVELWIDNANRENSERLKKLAESFHQ
jgi:hypothetical protein